MEIINLSENVIHTKNNQEEVFDFGNILKSSVAAVYIDLKGSNITDFKPTPYCGCSVPTATIINNNLVKLTILYKDTHLVRPFSKLIDLNFKENKEKKQVRIRIKGNVHEL